jgi:integrase
MGDMASVKKRPNGSWRARYRDETGREHARHFARQKDAQDWLDEITTSMRTGTYVDPKKATTTLADYFSEWGPRQIWASGTVTAMSLAIRSCDFKDVPFGKLRRSHGEAWVKAMEKRELAPVTIKVRVQNVHTVVLAAMKDRALPHDPLEGVRLPRMRRAEHAMAIPTPETVAAVIDAADDWFKTYVKLLAFAGLRLGEGAALQLGDFNFLKRNVHVQRQVLRAGSRKVEITPPKHGSERLVPLPDKLLSDVSRHVQEVGVWGDDQWLFVGYAGNPPNQDGIGYRWRKTLDDANIPRFKMHSLRHFYASGLIAAGCDVVTVQRAMGHASANITLDTYSHLWPSAEDKTRAAAASIMAETLEPLADSSRTETPVAP